MRSSTPGPPVRPARSTARLPRSPRARRTRGPRGLRRSLLAAGSAAALAITVAACGSSPAAPAASASAGAAAANPNVDPGTVINKRPAPDIHLVNQFRQPMSLSQFRGKVVLLAFVDSQCTTVCPLTTMEMLQAKQLLGAAGDQVQLLGVNANPRATTVSDVMAYSRVHDMVNKWDFLTGTKAQLAAVWKKYRIYSQISHGLVDHTPALYLIDQQGREREIYLTQMVYASISQQARILARQVAALLPGRPHLKGSASLAQQSSLGPRRSVRLPAATSSGTVTLAPGTAHLVMFFATWLSETSNLKAHLIALNAYAAPARASHLPPLTAVDEAVTEPSTSAVRHYLRGLGTRLAYPVGLDNTGRVADGYKVQDQPWFALTSASGKILWSHDGWLSVSALRAAVKAHTTGG